MLEWARAATRQNGEISSDEFLQLVETVVRADNDTSWEVVTYLIRESDERKIKGAGYDPFVCLYPEMTLAQCFMAAGPDALEFFLQCGGSPDSSIIPPQERVERRCTILSEAVRNLSESKTPAERAKFELQIELLVQAGASPFKRIRGMVEEYSAANMALYYCDDEDFTFVWDTFKSYLDTRRLSSWVVGEFSIPQLVDLFFRVTIFNGSRCSDRVMAMAIETGSDFKWFEHDCELRSMFPRSNKAASGFWSLQTQDTHPPSARKAIAATLCCAKRLGIHLPPELWLLIFENVTREDWRATPWETGLLFHENNCTRAIDLLKKRA